jgi:hypothetical protein
LLNLHPKLGGEAMNKVYTSCERGKRREEEKEEDEEVGRDVSPKELLKR